MSMVRCLVWVMRSGAGETVVFALFKPSKLVLQRITPEGEVGSSVEDLLDPDREMEELVARYERSDFELVMDPTEWSYVGHIPAGAWDHSALKVISDNAMRMVDDPPKMLTVEEWRRQSDLKARRRVGPPSYT